MTRVIEHPAALSGSRLWSMLVITASDEVLRVYAVGLLVMLEAGPRGDSVASKLHSDLRRILRESH